MKTNGIKNLYMFIVDVFYLSIITFATSLFGILLTTGAALSAAFHIMFYLLDQERMTYVFKEYMKSFKQNIKQSSIIWLIVLFFGTSLFFIFNYANNTNNTILLVSVYVALIELFLVVSYVFPMIGEFETPGIFATLKNAVLMAHAHILTSIKMIGTGALIVYLIFQVDSLFFFIGIPIYLFFNSIFLNKIFLQYKQRIIGDNDEVS